MEPPVSLPNATWHKSAATAAADPPEDPPDTFLGFLGLGLGSKNFFL